MKEILNQLKEKYDINRKELLWTWNDIQSMNLDTMSINEKRAYNYKAKVVNTLEGEIKGLSFAFDLLVKNGYSQQVIKVESDDLYLEVIDDYIVESSLLNLPKGRSITIDEIYTLSKTLQNVRIEITTNIPTIKTYVQRGGNPNDM